MVRVSLSQALDALVDLGRSYLEGSAAGNTVETVLSRCHDLVSLLGEASGTALAHEIVDRYESLLDGEKLEVLKRLEREFAPDVERIADTAQSFLASPDDESYRKLATAIEAPRQEFFRRLNMAPGGTAAIVGMRRVLLEHPGRSSELQGLEFDLKHLLASWFNRGFLQFERIEWSTSAFILEKLIQYEAVHEISGWNDLRRRLSRDRRCFAFFHPALPDEPLIFVEVALTRGLAGRIRDLIQSEFDADDQEEPDTAIFYSISNCQAGLAGISFGNLLIKQVVDALKTELPKIRRFATLSPVPGLRSWVGSLLAECDGEPVLDRDTVALLKNAGSEIDGDQKKLKSVLSGLCAAYLLKVRKAGFPLDPVARFHLGNGARVERIHWEADLSPKGVRQSYGIMVNYLYDPETIVANHEAYIRSGTVSASSTVSRQAARVITGETC